MKLRIYIAFAFLIKKVKNLLIQFQDTRECLCLEPHSYFSYSSSNRHPQCNQCPSVIELMVSHFISFIFPFQIYIYNFYEFYEFYYKNIIQYHSMVQNIGSWNWISNSFHLSFYSVFLNKELAHIFGKARSVNY